MEHFVSRKHLRPLEQCALSCLLPKVNLTEAQVGYVWGKSRAAVGKCKRKWLPKWGYAGKVITDLELYEDYVELERRTTSSLSGPISTTRTSWATWGRSATVRTF